VGAVILEYTQIRDELLAAEHGQMYLIGAAGLMVVMLIGLFELGIARRVAQPLQDLKTSVRRIALNDYAARVTVTSQDEIGLLGAAFNRMAEDLSLKHAEIVAHEHELEARVADRTRELDQSNLLLQEE